MDYMKRPEQRNSGDGQSCEDLIHWRDLSSLDPVHDVHLWHKYWVGPQFSAQNLRTPEEGRLEFIQILCALYKAPYIFCVAMEETHNFYMLLSK